MDFKMHGGAAMRDITAEDTVGTCPNCNQIVPVQVSVNTEKICYEGHCPDCGKFLRLEDRDDFASLGKAICTSSSLFEKKTA